MFLIAWRYRVSPEKRDAFISAYREGGAWSEFFASSPGYLRSRLFEAEGGSYLLLDAWASPEAYRGFLEARRAAYEALSGRYAGLYEEELKLGEYEEMGE